jgi:hypothetical protein
MEDDMTKSEMMAMYKNMSAVDERSFNRWLTANAVIASMFGAALLAMAFAGSNVSVSTEASAKAAQTTGAATHSIGRIGTISPYDLTIRYAPDQLPVEQVASPF